MEEEEAGTAPGPRCPAGGGFVVVVAAPPCPLPSLLPFLSLPLPEPPGVEGVAAPPPRPRRWGCPEIGEAAGVWGAPTKLHGERGGTKRGAEGLGGCAGGLGRRVSSSCPSAAAVLKVRMRGPAGCQAGGSARNTRGRWRRWAERGARLPGRDPVLKLQPVVPEGRAPCRLLAGNHAGKGKSHVL